MKTSSAAFRVKSCQFVDSVYDISKLPKDNRPQIAFAGRSNVGKSSLLNHLVRRKGMAKVSKTPGKTRCLNFFLINEKAYFVDLPGYGFAKVSKALKASWGKLIKDYLEQCESLAGLVFLIDCRRNPTEEDWQLIEWLSRRKLGVMTVVTKADKLNRDRINRRVNEVEALFGTSAIPFSIRDGSGKAHLTSAIGRLLEEHSKRMKA